MAIEIRQVTPDDVDSCVAMFFEAFNDLHEKYHYPAEDPEDNAWLRQAILHFLSTDPDLSLLALDDGEPVAFSSAYRRESFWFLSFLFVRPKEQASGIGRTLLERVLQPDGPPSPATHATVVESFQPVSTGLYASYGMAPRVPRYRLSGVKNPSAMPELPDGVRAQPVTGEMAGEFQELDRALLGYARPEDHRSWDGMDGFAFRRNGQLIGYGYIEDAKHIGPVAAEDEQTVAGIVRHLLERTEDPGKAGLGVLGWSGTLMRTLLEAGMRMDPASYPFVYCSSDTRTFPSYVPYTGYLP